MALPSSGQISMNDIRIELGVSSQSPFSLNTARQGGYVALNIFSPTQPPYSGQISLSDWYSYCQNCNYNTITLGYSSVDVITACATTPSTTYYYSGSLGLYTTLYTDVGGNQAAAGYYSDGTNWYYQTCPDGCSITDSGDCTSPSYDLYYADEYYCYPCTFNQSNVLVAFPAGTGIFYNRYYNDLSFDGIVYKLTSTASSGPGLILTTVGSGTNCTTVCSV